MQAGNNRRKNKLGTRLGLAIGGAGVLVLAGLAVSLGGRAEGASAGTATSAGRAGTSAASVPTETPASPATAVGTGFERPQGHGSRDVSGARPEAVTHPGGLRGGALDQIASPVAQPVQDTPDDDPVQAPAGTITIATGPDPNADGYLAVTPDDYGSWTSVTFGGGGDIYNPNGAHAPLEATFSSGLLVFDLFTSARELLSDSADWQAVFPADATFNRGVILPLSASDTNGDAVNDQLLSSFEVTGSGRQFSCNLLQRVENLGSGVAQLVQIYDCFNSSNLMDLRLVRAYDGDQLWVGDFGDDEVGTDFHGTGNPVSVFEQEAGDASTRVRLEVTSATGQGPVDIFYYGGKHGVTPGGGPPPYDFGTDTEVWDAFGVPTSWLDHIAGVGYGLNGVSGAAPPGSTDPRDGFVGVQVDFGPIGISTPFSVTFTHTYGVPGCQKESPPGQDCWSTQCGDTQFDFSNDPIPAGFFGPGSDPFTGAVNFQGFTGFQDTIIDRLDTMCFDGVEPVIQSVPIQLTQLQLVSCAPITVTFNGGQNPTPFDVYPIAETNLSGPQPIGLLTAAKTNPGGGTYDTDLPINIRFKFVPAGGPFQGHNQECQIPGPPFDQLCFPPIPGSPPINQTLASTGNPWSQVVPPFGPSCGTGPAGAFHPGVPKDDNSCCPESCHSSFGQAPHEHCVRPPKCPPCLPEVGACCDKNGICSDGVTQADCELVQGVHHPNASCTDPGFTCDIGCIFDNGPPNDDNGLAWATAQLDLVYPFVTASADDFYLNDQGTNPCEIQSITTWVGHTAAPGLGTDTPLDYDGIHVTVYANADPKGPGGRPEVDGTHTETIPGGVVFTQFVTNFTWTPVTLPCWNGDQGPTFELQIPVTGLDLEKKTKYWLEIMPQVSFADLSYQTVLMFSELEKMHVSQRGFPELGEAFWEGRPANLDGCPPDTPPVDTLHGVAFRINGVKPCEKEAPPDLDCWRTECGSTQFDFSDSPIPADFFGPGSDPFNGAVNFQGFTGFQDTVINRLDSMCFDGVEPVSASTAIQLQQLELVSCDPITVTFNGGQNPTLYDVYPIAETNLSGPQPIGLLTATKTNPGGGTYDTDLPINIRFKFVPAGGPFIDHSLECQIPGPPFSDLCFPPIFPAPDPPITQTLSSTGNPWSQVVPPFGPSCGTGPVGSFHPGVPKDDNSCCPESCHSSFGQAPHEHCVRPPKCPACPEVSVARPMPDPAVGITRSAVPCASDVDCKAGLGLPASSEIHCVPAPADGGGPSACYVKRNRWFGVDPNPNNAGTQTARRVQLSTGETLGWVGPPVSVAVAGEASPQWRSYIQATSHYMDWSTVPTVQVGGCPIQPGYTFAIQAIASGSDENDEASYSESLLLGMVELYGDVVGFVVNTPPDKDRNFKDISSVVAGFQSNQHEPKVWLDLVETPAPPAGADSSSNWPGIDFNDIDKAVKGFQNQGYLYSAPCDCAAGCS